jgi:hypothetical protein
MKTFLTALLITGCVAFTGSFQASATLIANWTFETSVPTTAGPHAAEHGVNAASSFASGFHGDATAVYSNPVGNGSSESFSSTKWAVGDYWQFQASTLGYAGIQISWDQAGSSTGPRDFALQYSLTGLPASFATLDNYLVKDVASEGWASSGAPKVGSHYFRDLSGTLALNNAATIFFRLRDNSTVSINGGTVATTGTDRVDNFSISALTTVPETSTWYSALGLSLALLGSFARNKSQRS